MKLFLVALTLCLLAMGLAAAERMSSKAEAFDPSTTQQMGGDGLLPNPDRAERSSDRDKPALLTSNVINDDLDGSDDQYFYKFSAGSGKLTVTFEVKASGTNAGAMLDLFDAKATPILSDVLVQGVDGGSERVVKNIQFSRKRTS